MSRGSEKNWGSGWGWGASKRMDPKGQPLPREQYPAARAEVADRLLTATGLCGGLWWQLPREHGPRLGPGPSWHVSHRKGSPDWVEEHRAPGRVQCPARGPSSLPGKRPAMWGRGAVLSVTHSGWAGRARTGLPDPTPGLPLGHRVVAEPLCGQDRLGENPDGLPPRE